MSNQRGQDQANQAQDQADEPAQGRMSQAGQPRAAGGPPRTASLNQGVDMLVDTAQGLKNFVNGTLHNVIDAGQDAEMEVNELLDKLIDRLQKLKG